MKIYLNGSVYTLEAGSGVQRIPLVEWPANTRFDGQQQRKDRSDISSWAIDNWSQGLGIQRINTSVSSQLYRLWEVENCDTRHPSQIVLSPQMQVPTIVPSRGNLHLDLEYLGNLNFVDTAHPNVGSTLVYQFTAPNTIGSFSVLAAETLGSIVGSISAIKAFGNKIGMVGWGARTGTGQQGNFMEIGNIGGALDDSECISLGTGSKFSLFPQLESMGGTIHLIGYDGGLNRVSFYIGNQDLSTMVGVGTAKTVIGSYLAELKSDGLTMYTQLPEGVYDFDATPAVAIDTGRARDKNCAQILFNNELYFKNKKSLIHYDGTNIEDVGYDLNDGLPTEQFGEITAMAAAGQYLFAAVKGGTYSHILTRQASEVWQYYTRIPTAGIWVRRMFVSDAPDAIDRLWCIFGSASHPGYFLNPLTNPLMAGTYCYVATGHFGLPIFDGGMAEEPGAFYNETITCDGIGGNNKITCLYGLNGANPVSTLGVVATITETLKFGSPYGVEGYRIQPDFLMAGANNGTTPIFRNAIIHYLKLPKERESFEFAVDLEETARAEIRPLEAVIGSLNSERASRTLMPFWYGIVPTKTIKVMQMPFQEDVQEDEIFQGERHGIVQLRVAEII